MVQVPSESIFPGRILGWMILTILLVIVVTELLDVHLDLESDLLEGLIHVISLSITLAPVFYFFWYRPLLQQQAERQRSEDEVRSLYHRLLAAGDEERRKLARELHDDFGQRLILLQLQVETLQQALVRGEQPAPEVCAPLTTLIREIGDDLRSAIANLRPGVLEDLGLVAALEALCSEAMTRQAGLRVNFSINGNPRPAAREVETVLFRACQEALANVVRHAGAKRVEVQLTSSYPELILVIEDDGAGLPAPGSTSESYLGSGHFGLIGMRERVTSVGGSVRMASKPGEGTRIRVAIPAMSLEN